MKIEFKNKSSIETIESGNSIRGKRSKIVMFESEDLSPPSNYFCGDCGNWHQETLDMNYCETHCDCYKNWLEAK